MSEIKPIRGVVLRDAMELTGATVTIVDVVSILQRFNVVADNGERFSVHFKDIALLDLPVLVQKAYNSTKVHCDSILYGVANHFFYSSLLDYLDANNFLHIKPKT